MDCSCLRDGKSEFSNEWDIDFPSCPLDVPAVNVCLLPRGLWRMCQATTLNALGLQLEGGPGLGSATG